ncbi:host specificity factor TipJ family phage tail protein [Pseudomonas sp. Hp2]|uniref:host specificity factor TipJ family phage tail protein n=1 Tax=Pseudomonas sp. Hp2 TaxID=701189 RepID=UPI0015A95CC2|nr:host specificity factor TipJ family phage tail protein [Pseudomonas sp. Hp2]
MLVINPHPLLADGLRSLPADLRPGESLYAFLSRHVEGLDGEPWAVAVDGEDVPRHLWHQVHPRNGQVIEVRGVVGRAAVSLVAMAALTYFTFGIGGYGGFIATEFGKIAATGVYMAGSVLINKVLAPKVPKVSSSTQSTYSLGNPQNRARQYEPLGLLFGAMRIAPDLASNPYTWYEGDDQYLSMILTPGINVDRVDDLYNGDALMTSYEGVQTWFDGFGGMASQKIPLYSNADVVEGGTLIDTTRDPKNKPGEWVQRTSSADTIRLIVGIEYQLWDKTTKGGDKNNREVVEIQYRPVGASAWQMFGNYVLNSKTQKNHRVSYGKDVPPGTYDVRVRVGGWNTDGSGASCMFQWTTLTSVQQDTTDYAGIPRIGIKAKATGQFNGSPNEIRCVAHSTPIPVWNGTQWSTQESSNPGAQILAYARGITDRNGKRIAGIGLPDYQIDIEALQGFMLHCAAHGYTYDNWITDARSHDDILTAVALAGMGQITWAKGRLSVAWAAEDQPLSGVVNMATIKKGQFQVDYTLANAADGIEYTYLDRQNWETKTLRVPAPGVTTMLNPAQVTGEGVTSEAHAAVLARWHLAQSLYQYKSIGYSTDLEHLSYRRLSVLALQHDLTQWGYGGRVRAATIGADNAVRLTLDEPIPAPANGNAFIGLRIPGEKVYRIFKVKPFGDTSRTIELSEPWPGDAALPGDSDKNPAWDTLWIYDFKQTPGYRVRVTGIQPENDLKGASVSVVAEGPEFWNYVLTGEYVPAPNQSLLQTRPVASDLKITERQVVQGDTVYTELQASFEVSGPVARSIVLSDLDGNGELEQVAETTTRAASWRIPGAGTYPITVRPFNQDGLGGVAATINYTTRGADAAPVLVDYFNVEDLPGGLRRYSWGFHDATIQSPDFAGVEIRYVSGDIPSPAWDDMDLLGSDGYHATTFESTLPAAGTYTFLVRSRNTSGALSTSSLRLAKTLSGNLGEVIGGIEQGNEQTKQELLEQIANEAEARVQEDARVAAEAAAALRQEAAAQAAALEQTATDIRGEVAEQVGQLNQDLSALQSEVGDLFGADQWSATTAYSQGALVMADGVIYKAQQNVPAGTPVTNTTYWQALGNYAQLSDQVQAQAASITSLSNRVTSAEGTITSQGQAITQLQQQVVGKADASALTALTSRVSTAEGTITSQGQAITSLTNRIGTAEGNISAQGAAITSLSNRVTSAEGTLTSQGQSITTLQNSIGNIGGENLLTNSSFEIRTSDTSAPTDWGLDTGGFGSVTQGYVDSPLASSTKAWRGEGTSSSASNWIGLGRVNAIAAFAKVQPGTVVTFSVYARGKAGTTGLFVLSMYNQAGTVAVSAPQLTVALTESWTRYTFTTTVPNDAYFIRTYIRGRVAISGMAVWFEFDNAQLQVGSVATQYEPSVSEAGAIAAATASAVSSLTTRVAAAEGAITSQGQAITQLTNRVSTAEGNISANSNAIGSLTSRVSSAEGAITSQGQSLTSLQNNIGQTKTYKVLSAANGSSRYGQSGVWNAANTRIVTAFRGLTLALLQNDGTWSATTYDVYNDANARQSLSDALAGLSNTQYFAMFGNDSFEPGKAVWSAAAIACGASQAAIDKIGNRFAYILIGRGKLGAGNGTELISTTGNTVDSWVERGIQVLGNVILDVSGNAAAVQGLEAVSAAITSLTSRVQTAEGTITSQGQSITSLQNSIKASGGSNLLTDPSFESRLWTLTHPAVTSYLTDVAYSGSVSLWFGPSTNFVRIAQAPNEIQLVPGRTYRVGTWYRTSADFNGTAGNSKLRISGMPGDGFLDQSVFTANKLEWTKAEVTFTVPTAATYVSLNVRVQTDHTVGALRVDGCYVYDVTDTLTGAANSSAITGLSSTVASQGGQITSQGQQITSLQNDTSALYRGTSNLAVLGDFEAYADGAYLINNNTGTAQVQTGTVYIDSKALKITCASATSGGNMDVYLGNAFTTTPSRTYYFEGWLRVDSAGTAPTTTILRLGLRCINTANGNVWITGTQTDLSTVAPNTWVRVTGYATSPSNAVKGLPWISVPSTGRETGVIVYVDQFVIRDVTEGYNAQQLANANSNALVSLTSRVQTAEGTITSQGQSITSLQNSISNVGGDNLLKNSSFEIRANDTSAPTGYSTDGTLPSRVVSYVDSPLTGSVKAVRMEATSTAASQYMSLLAVVDKSAPNQPHTLSCWARGLAGTRFNIYIQYLDSGNAVINTYTSPNFSITESFARYTFNTGASPANTVKARAYVGRIFSSASGQALWMELDNAQFQEGTVATNWAPSIGETAAATTANSDAITSLTSRLTAAEGSITSQSNSLTALSNRVTTAESNISGQASAITSLQSTVTQQGNTLSSHTSQITSLSSSVAGKADVSIVQSLETKVNANLNGSGNLLVNSTFAESVEGWMVVWGQPAGSNWGRDWEGVSLDQNNEHVLGASWPSNPADQNMVIYNSQPVGVTAGDWLIFSAWLLIRGGARVRVAMKFQSNSNGNIAEPSTSYITPATADWGNVANWTRVFLKVQVPAGATKVQCGMWANTGTAGGDGAAWMARPMLERVQADATGPSPWAPGGSEAMARVTLALTTDKLVSGYSIANDGKISEFNILSNIFRVLTPGSADGLELRDGYLRVWKGNAQRIIGTGFGAGGDNLIDYFGPNVGAGAASKANAVMWMDANGNAYWGGSLSAGALKNAVQTTTTQTIGTELINGPFATNGRNRTVAISFSRTHVRTNRNMGNQGFVAGSGSNTATIQVYRKIGNGGEALWQTVNATGGVSIMNEFDGPDSARSSWSGAVTFNDSSSSAETVQYRAVITGFSEQSVTHQSGSFTGQSITQSLSIVSVEQ